MWAAWMAILLAGPTLPVGPEAKWVRPIGFSSEGKLAYEQENPLCQCQGGRCTEEIPMCAYEQALGTRCDRPCRRVEAVLVDLRTDRVLQRVDPPPPDVGAFGIARQRLEFVALPHRFGNDRYSIELSKGCDDLADLEGDYDKVHECAVYLVSGTRGAKRVYTFRSRVLRGFRLTLQGALFSPQGDRVALLFQQRDTPFENEGPSRPFFVGADLERGFQPASPK